MIKYRNSWILLIVGCLFHLSALGDENHYKNVLVGDRAATMGGAYVAVSDDSSGTYYNPAGIAFAFGSSVSGSGNAYHSTTTRYHDTIGSSDWLRESNTILPNFFGMIKKLGEYTLAFSYIVPDSKIEHQDQVYAVNNANVKRYYISLHSEDNVNIIGPSFAYKINDGLSVGGGLFYSYRIYRHQFRDFAENQNGSITTNYVSTLKEENSFLTKLGVQLSPFDPLFIGVTISQRRNGTVKETTKRTSIVSPSFTLAETTTVKAKSYPIQLSVGGAYYPSPSLLISGDIDYFKAAESRLKDIINYSLGSELFLDANSAVRFGLFTNYDNRKACDRESCDEAHIDMNGMTVGYSSYTRTSSFTLGAVYSTGAGKAQVYGSGTPTVDVDSQSLTVLFAANYDY